ncbi:hypothetical protein pdul_cds_591 [Pandoravirus dulcis]|uniref:Uncharacterized protein n=1 Tax=Pandoravirus dulcis TaxID=1349409 RepID=S4VR06_9VIRU|nr:hypothetical protein pdul_cds_591 [Pandoravirus dulcis]AGO82712.1 hypothetical protein pdul_cds_591 [Pandoravirus dulcis]
MDARLIAEMGRGAGWWCRERTEWERIIDDKVDEPVSVWLDRALACVAADGAVDWAALAGVGFTHDLVLARRLVASHSHRDGGLVVCNVSAEHDGRASERFNVEVHRGTFLEPAPADAEVPATRSWRWATADLPPIQGGDDVVAGLVALAASLMPASVHARGSNMSGARLISLDTWAVRIGHALATRTTPWSSSGLIRELALARALLAFLVEDATSLQGDDHIGERRAVDTKVAPRFGAPLSASVAADAAAVYERALGEWTRMRLDEFHEGTCWGSDQGDGIATPLWLGVVSALGVFLLAGERFSGAPAANAGPLAPTLFDSIDAHHGADLDSSPNRRLDRD